MVGGFGFSKSPAFCLPGVNDYDLGHNDGETGVDSEAENLNITNVDENTKMDKEINQKKKEK